MSVVRPPARFGAVKLNGDCVDYFKEKSFDQIILNGYMINNGIMNKDYFEKIITVFRRKFILKNDFLAKNL